jgi:transposase
MPAIEEVLIEIKGMLACLIQREQVKQCYSTAEVAAVLGRAEYTVREWCRQGRVVARKKSSGRGRSGEWLISHEELMRLRNEGLLPLQRPV